MWAASSLTVDRKSGDRPMIHVERAAVSICGGIQPGTLRSAIGREHVDDGLLARLLLAMPERRPRRWTDATIDDHDEEAITAVFARLLAMGPNEGDDGETCPVDVPMTAEAKSAFKAFVDEHGREQCGLAGDLAAAWSKLEAYAARLALVFHCVQAGGGAVGVGSVRSGIELARWFGSEARRVYAALAATEEAQGGRSRLVAWIQGKGGHVTARELQRGPRAYRKGDAADKALMALVSSGNGVWEAAEPGVKGGQPTRVFVLAPGPATQPPPTVEKSVPSPSPRRQWWRT